MRKQSEDDHHREVHGDQDDIQAELQRRDRGQNGVQTMTLPRLLSDYDRHPLQRKVRKDHDYGNLRTSRQETRRTTTMATQ
eukprot:430477-Amphidinium_carterae.1